MTLSVMMEVMREDFI